MDTEVKNERKELVKDNLLLISNIAQDLNKKQMQLLAYSLYRIEKDKNDEYVSRFKLTEFMSQFEILKDNYKKKEVIGDLDRLGGINLKTVDEILFSETSDKGRYTRMNFIAVAEYSDGIISVKWIQNEEVLNILLGTSKEVSKYKLDTLAKLGKSGWELYDVINLFNQRGEKRKSFSLGELATLFRAKGQKADKFNYLNTRYIKPSIEQINSETDIYVTEKRIYKGRKVVGIEFNWQSQKTDSSITEEQDNKAKELLVSFEKYNPLYLEDNEYQKIQKSLLHREQYNSTSFYNVIKLAIAKMKNIQKELATSSIDDFELQDIEPFENYFIFWDGNTIRPNQKIEFVTTAKRFNEAERPRIIRKAFDISKERESSSFGYVIKVLSTWADKGITTYEEANADYNDNFGGFDYNQKKKMEDIDISPDFLGAINSLWMDNE